MTTLDDLLALLPDNTSGDISAADLRTIVTELYNDANTRSESYAYDFTTDVTPATGKVATDQGWQMSVTTLLLNETTGDGMVFPIVLLDRLAVEDRARLILAMPGSSMTMTVTGQSVDQGTYRSIPVTPTKLVGVAPANNALMTLALVVLP